MSARTLGDRIDDIVGRLPGGPADVHGAVVRVEVPRAGVAHAAAAGTARADTGEPMTTGHRIHVASVGKMFTGTLVMEAAAAGRFGPLGVDTPLGSIGALDAGLMRRVHPAGPTITVRHLLTHTSGMKDIQGDDASGVAADLGGRAPHSVQAGFERSLGALAAGDPAAGDGFALHRWTPWDPHRPDDPMAGMLNRLVATGTAARPVGAPGERFHYSDTAYVLLGVLVEAVTGTAYHELQRAHVTAPLGLTDTYLAYHDDPTPDARRHEADVWYGGLPLLSLGANLSFDWAGGGQVSTVADLCRFLRALVGGELHDDPAVTAARLAGTAPAHLPTPFHTMGLGWFTRSAGRRVVGGHSGAWGVRVFHDATTGAFVAGSVGQPDECAWLAEVFDAVEAELP